MCDLVADLLRLSQDLGGLLFDNNDKRSLIIWNASFAISRDSIGNLKPQEEHRISVSVTPRSLCFLMKRVNKTDMLTEGEIGEE